MANVGNIWASIKLNISDFAQNMTRASQMMGRFAAQTANTAAGIGSGFREYGKEIKAATKELNQHKIELKDVTRIVSGIVISQAFYGVTRSIRESNRALWEFNESLDYANVTYSALFGSTELGSGFLQVLRDHAEETIFSFEELTEVTKKLLAYGIPYQNLMYITEGLTNLGAMSGDAAALDRIALALGQIYTRGKLSAEEMRQLANAYVPIYEIIQSKFGLTGEQMGRVGDLNLPANEVIDAVVDYANEAFGGVADAAMLTIRGLKQKIVDSVKNMAVDMLAPVSSFYKALLIELSAQLQGIEGAFSTGGIGGIFEHLVPDENAQERIRQFLSAVHNLFVALTRAASVAADFAGVFFNSLAGAFTFIAPFFTTTINLLSGLAGSMLSNANAVKILSWALMVGAAAWTAYKVRALAAMATAALAKVVYGLASAVLFLSRVLVANPIVTMIFLIGTGLAAAAASADNANNAISRLFNSLSGYGGAVADDILQPTQGLGEASNDLDKFNDRMSDATDSMNAAGDAAGKAGDAASKAGKKAAKGLLSFDEVYRLNDPAGGSGSGSGSGAGGALGNIGQFLEDLGGIGSGLGEMLEVPDLSDYTDKFVDQLFGDMWDSIKAIASGGAYGALIGGLAGFAIGGIVTRTMAGALAGAKLGAKIGTVAGAAFAGFWTDTFKEMQDSLSRIAIGSGVGALVGALAGFVLGAFATRNIAVAMQAAKMGAGLGALLGAGFGTFWAAASAEMSNALEGILVGASSGMLAGALAGFVIGAFATRNIYGAIQAAKIGAGLGAAIGAGLGGFWATAGEQMKQAIETVFISSGVATGVLVGGLAGMVIGAFVTRTTAGALAGAKLGASIAGLVMLGVSPVFAAAEESITEGITGMFSGVTAATHGALIGGLAGMLVGALVGAFAGAGIGALPGAKMGAMIGSGLGAMGGFVVDWLNNSGVAEAFGEWVGGIVDTFEDFLSGLFEGIVNWSADTVQTFVDWKDSVISTFLEWIAGIAENLSSWSTSTVDSFLDWISTTGKNFTSWVTNTNKTFTDWKEDIKRTVGTWSSEVKTKFDQWVTENVSSIISWSTDTKSRFNAWKTEVYNTFELWKEDVKTSFINWKGSIRDTFTTWKNETVTTVALWVDDIVDKFNNWAYETKLGIDAWRTSTEQKFAEWRTVVKKAWENIWDPDFWRSGWSLISDWFSDMLSDISSWFTSAGRKVTNWWDNLWDLDAPSVRTPSLNLSGSSARMAGHATGGIFTREHIARFAEGNKAEMVVPLENQSAMQPFVTAISNGIIEGLAPSMLAIAGGNGGSRSSLPPMYVGTLIADERGLKELYKKFELYEAKEMARKGLS